MVRKHEGDVAINSDEQQSVGVAMDVCNGNVIVKKSSSVLREQWFKWHPGAKDPEVKLRYLKVETVTDLIKYLFVCLFFKCLFVCLYSSPL
jgi:hypothetical protein